jgi:hypothetical protein
MIARVSDPNEDGAPPVPRHVTARWSFVDRLVHGKRRPLAELGNRGWTALGLSEFAWLGLAIENLAKRDVAGVGWLALAITEAALFAWYVRRPVEK